MRKFAILLGLLIYITPALAVITPPGFVGRVGQHGGGRVVTLTLHYDYLLDSGSTIAQSVLKGPVPVYTAASNRMAFDSSGNLAYAPHQLLPNSKWIDRTGDTPDGWTKLGTGTITWVDQSEYATGTFSATGDRATIVDGTPVLPATTYTIAAYIESSALPGSVPILRGSDTSGINGEIKDSDWDALGGVPGWYAVGFTMGAADDTVLAAAGMIFVDTGSVTMSRPVIVKGLIPGVGVGVPAKISGPPLGRWIGTDDGDEPLYDQPRYAHDPADSNAQLGLLMEEARTNFVLQSENLATSWNNVRSSETVNAATAPDGNTTADKFIADATEDTSHWITQSLPTLTDNAVYTFSVFLKAADVTFARVEVVIKNASSAYVFYNIATGVKSGATLGTIVDSGVIDAGDGWYRCWFSVDVVSGGQTPAIRFYLAEGDNDSNFAGNISGDGFFVWGAQTEAGSSPTSYIPTTTAQVTRAADVPPTTTDVSGVNASNLSVFVQAVIPHVSAQERSLFTIDDGGTTDVIRLYMDAAENVNFETVNSGDTDGASEGAATIAVNTVFKAMGTAEDDSVIGYVDGTGSTEDTSAGIPVTDAATTIRIGGNSGSTVLNGYMQIAKMWNVTKPAAFGASETTAAANDNAPATRFAANDNWIEQLREAVGW